MESHVGICQWGFDRKHYLALLCYNNIAIYHLYTMLYVKENHLINYILFKKVILLFAYKMLYSDPSPQVLFK